MPLINTLYNLRPMAMRRFRLGAPGIAWRRIHDCSQVHRRSIDHWRRRGRITTAGSAAPANSGSGRIEVIQHY